jgi:hypothetical protein
MTAAERALQRAENTRVADVFLFAENHVQTLAALAAQIHSGLGFVPYSEAAQRSLMLAARLADSLNEVKANLAQQSNDSRAAAARLGRGEE